MSQKKKSALIALIAFIGGLLSGLVGAPYAGLVDAGTKAATEVVESIPDAPPVVAPSVEVLVTPAPVDVAAPTAPTEAPPAPAAAP